MFAPPRYSRIAARRAAMVHCSDPHPWVSPFEPGFRPLPVRMIPAAPRRRIRPLDVQCVSDVNSARQHKDFPNETRDCTVRALAACLGVPYFVAHDRMAKLGRKDKHGVPFCLMARRIPELQEVFTEPRMSGYPICKFTTLGQLWPHLSSGRFIVLVNQHAFAVVDGKIVNDGTSTGYYARRKKVYHVYQYAPSPVLDYSI